RTAAGGAAAPAAPPAAPAGTAGGGQRVFIKITPAAENPALLSRLQALLQTHPGPAATLLFYEREQRVLALSDSYRIEPSPELFAAVEEMLGAGTVRIK
ncbi:hypothetical protein, partial [Paenibacillus sp. DMB5]|uniref:hypothetical protein n=1 Tax=Paenibacillus sp. DMB5 TaxID=1780103 RepID=UPI000ACE40B5